MHHAAIVLAAVVAVGKREGKGSTSNVRRKRKKGFEYLKRNKFYKKILPFASATVGRFSTGAAVGPAIGSAAEASVVAACTSCVGSGVAAGSVEREGGGGGRRPLIFF